MICGYRPWIVLSWKGAHEVLSSSPWSLREKGIWFKRSLRWPSVPQTLPAIHLPTEVTGDAICPHDRSRVSLRKPGSVRTCSQPLVTEPWLLNKSGKHGDQQSWPKRQSHQASRGPGHFRLLLCSPWCLVSMLRLQPSPVHFLPPPANDCS